MSERTGWRALVQWLHIMAPWGGTFFIGYLLIPALPKLPTDQAQTLVTAIVPVCYVYNAHGVGATARLEEQASDQDRGRPIYAKFTGSVIHCVRANPRSVVLLKSRPIVAIGARALALPLVNLM